MSHLEWIVEEVLGEFRRKEPMFPVGCCDVASFTLAKILLDEGYEDVKLVRLPNMKHWLVKAEGVWIDLTISQFYDGSGAWALFDTQTPEYVLSDEPVEYDAAELVEERKNLVDEEIVAAVEGKKKVKVKV